MSHITDGFLNAPQCLVQFLAHLLCPGIVPGKAHNRKQADLVPESDAPTGLWVHLLLPDFWGHLTYFPAGFSKTGAVSPRRTYQAIRKCWINSHEHNNEKVIPSCSQGAFDLPAPGVSIRKVYITARRRGLNFKLSSQWCGQSQQEGTCSRGTREGCTV